MNAPPDLHIRLLQSEDIGPIISAFAAIGWNKSASQYERYLAEQTAEARVVLVAFIADHFAGYVTIQWQPGYPPFRAANIPEIQDFNVLPHYRRQHIGTALLDEAEHRIAQRSPIAGIGVGLYADYGPAQRMYVLRGYVPDGRGVAYDNRVVQPGDQVRVDDALVLSFTKNVSMDVGMK
ncbi:MAG: GNAT family N-acetyltransferase [Herpetosiphonaceae bacterium]|nr:GNAT family N-acetyltransferase [Herpetosiphonaceae bacterium]